MADSPPPPPSPEQNQPQQQSVRSSKVPLPRYTSIDLESELPEIYNTSLNPNLHDPDMTMFFNRNAPPFHSNWSKRHSPPPMYQSRSKSGSNSSIQSTPSTKSQSKRLFSRNCFAGAFLCIFLVTPALFLLVFYIIPRIVVVNRPMNSY